MAQTLSADVKSIMKVLVMQEDLSKLVPTKPLPLPSSIEELRREVLRLRDEIVGLRAQLAEAEVTIKRQHDVHALTASPEPAVHVEYLKGVVADLESQLIATRSSTTWRLGRLLLAPARAFRR